MATPFYIAKVIDNSKYTDEDCIDVVFIRNSSLFAKVRVLHDRANPLYGISGNLPDIGEVGIVVMVQDYGEEWFWLGSYHDPCDNICTGDTAEYGRTLFHHESDVYYQILSDGTVEFSHPSGTFIKLGGIALKDRNRFQRVDGTSNKRERQDYPPRQAEPVDLMIQHTRNNSGLSNSQYELDERKHVVSGDIKKTFIRLDTTGNIFLDHETNEGTHMRLTINSNGDTSIESNHILMTGIAGQETAVTINGTLHTTNWVHCDTDMYATHDITAGNDVTGTHYVYDIDRARSMQSMANTYNPHQHGNSSPPNNSM